MATLAAFATVVTGLVAGPAQAAKADACLGGAYQLVNLTSGAVVAAGEVDGTVPASALGDRFGVRGRYVQFDVRASDFAVLDYAFTGAPNDEDMTGGRFTPVWESKVPDLRGSTLTSAVAVQLSAEDMVIARSGGGASIKIQAKDCATGGIFQMEPQRRDGQRTRIVHTLAQSAVPGLTPFFFDNPNFRARVGQFLGDDCVSVVTGPPSRFCVQVSTRVNIANDLSPDFVARDSAQVADRVNQPACNTAAPVTPSVRHCGGVSIWDVASGGRMGFVTGEDAVEVANPPTNCVQNCQAQNRVRGRLAVLGFPFPVPAGSRLTPRSTTAALPPIAAPPAPATLTPPAPRLRAALSGTPGGRVTATARWRVSATARAAGVRRVQVRAVKLGRHGRVLAVTLSPRIAFSAGARTMTLSRGSYRFQVRSINAVGTSAWSARSTRVRAR